MRTRDFDQKSFQYFVSTNNHVLVYWWAPLCEPCDTFTPVYEESAKKHFDVVHGKVNFEVEQDLVKAADVTLLPTLMAFKKGKLVFKQGGVADLGLMDELVRQLRAYKFKDEVPPSPQQGLL